MAQPTSVDSASGLLHKPSFLDNDSMSDLNLTSKRVRELLNYDKDTGIFTWKVSRRNQFTKPGMLAGFKDTSGYMGIEIDGKRYLSHRLAWFYLYDKWPDDEIDHINRVRDDNKIKNLRIVTHYENTKNKGNYKNNTTGFKGVTIKNNRFTAQITFKGKCRHIGCFETAEQASEAYQNELKKLLA